MNCPLCLDHFQFAGAGEGLDFRLGLQRLAAQTVGFRIHQSRRAAASQVLRPSARMVQFEAARQVIRHARVIGSVRAPKYVNITSGAPVFVFLIFIWIQCGK